MNWLEVFDGDLCSQIESVRQRSRLELRRTARFARLNVGNVRQKVAQEAQRRGIEIGIVPDRLCAEGKYPADPSHALITGLPPVATDREDEEDDATTVSDLIAECVISPPHLARID